MYSTSSEQTRVIWAAHSYNVAFTDEIGDWQYCNGVAVPATGGGSSHLVINDFRNGFSDNLCPSPGAWGRSER
jgi:hypothetical protein